MTLGREFPEGSGKTESTVNRRQKESFVTDDKIMKPPNSATEAHNMAAIQSGVPEVTGKNGPSLAEIHQRAREIHIKRGGHVCDMDNYLDEWLQAERELQESYNKSSCG